MNEKYYRMLTGEEKHRVIERSRRLRMNDIVKQKPIDNFQTRHRGYGEPLPKKANDEHKGEI